MLPNGHASEFLTPPKTEEEVDETLYEDDEEEDYYQLMVDSYNTDLSCFMEGWAAAKKARKEAANGPWQEFLKLWEVEKQRQRDELSHLGNQTSIDGTFGLRHRARTERTGSDKEWWEEAAAQLEFMTRVFPEDETADDWAEGWTNDHDVEHGFS